MKHARHRYKIKVPKVAEAVKFSLADLAGIAKAQALAKALVAKLPAFGPVDTTALKYAVVEHGSSQALAGPLRKHARTKSSKVFRARELQK